MTNKLETLPNEILILIFSNLSWSEIIISLWSINKRFDFLICLTFSMNNIRCNNGISVTQPGLSYIKCSSVLLPIISNSSSLSSSIRRIHFDEANSSSSELVHKWLFDNEKQILRFPNLKSLIITECVLSAPLLKSLSLLVEHQLDELRFTFDEDIFGSSLNSQNQATSTIYDSEKLSILFQEFLYQILSSQSRLTSLQLGAISSDFNVQRCLIQRSHLFSNTISNELSSCCITLRCLNIHLPYICFLEDLIERIPNLERLSIHSECLLRARYSTDSNIASTMLSTENWFNKIPKLQYFSLKSDVSIDLEFAYLKWLLNNLNYIQKLRLHLECGAIYRPDQMICKSCVDANFIRQYFLPDTVYDLIDFEFYIASQCLLSSKDVENIINSFKVDSFYIDRQWANVKCFYDRNTSYQHLFSSKDNTIQHFDGLCNHPYISEWPYIRYIRIDLHPSLYLFLEQLDELFPDVSCINVDTERYTVQSQNLISLIMPFKMGQHKLTDIKFRNVTKLQFGICHTRSVYSCHSSIDRKKERAKVLAHLISMPVQLKHLVVETFEWLLHVVQYASNELGKNALNAVRYAEFGIPSCHSGDNESIHIGKHLLPFLTSYMSHIQTLRLWRPDDFPWTSIRPDFKPAYLYISHKRWILSLQTPQSIAQHVDIFEQDLNQLVEQLKQLVFLDIYGEIRHEKVEPYRLMVQTLFPNSQIIVKTSRFRLWL